MIGILYGYNGRSICRGFLHRQVHSFGTGNLAKPIIGIDEG